MDAEKSSNKLLECKLSYDVMAFRMLFKVLKKCVDDITIEFKQDDNDQNAQKREGIFITTIDKYRSLSIDVRLNAANFDTFKLTKPIYKVGVDLSQLYNCIKFIKEHEILTISIDDDDPSNLIFDIENEAKTKKTHNKLQILNINRSYKIPRTKFDATITVDSNRFRDICEELNSVSDFIEIVCNRYSLAGSDSVTFIGKYQNGEKRITLEDDIHFAQKTDIVSGIYELRPLVKFSKYADLCSDVQLYIKNDFPIFIKYNLSRLGRIFVGHVQVEAVKSISKPITNMDNITQLVHDNLYDSGVAQHIDISLLPVERRIQIYRGEDGSRLTCQDIAVMLQPKTIIKILLHLVQRAISPLTIENLQSLKFSNDDSILQQIINAMLENNIETEKISVLLDQINDVNYGNSVSGLDMNPLLHGCHTGKLDLVRVLVEKYNADIETHDNDSAIFVAMRQNHANIAKYLYYKGAKIIMNNENNDLIREINQLDCDVRNDYNTIKQKYDNLVKEIKSLMTTD